MEIGIQDEKLVIDQNQYKNPAGITENRFYRFVLKIMNLYHIIKQTW